MRLDQWLWCVRVYKSRSIAVEAIRAGHVQVNDATPKPAREVHPGETIVARVGDRVRILKALAAPRSRVAARDVPAYAEDLTPAPDPASRPDPALAPVGLRPRGAGRPTKRDRRRMEDLFGG